MMEFIPMKVLEHRLDDEGYTESIIVEFNYYKGRQRFNVGIELTNDIVKDVNENFDLETISKAQIDRVARRKLVEWVNVERDIEEEEPEEEGEDEDEE